MPDEEGRCDGARLERGVRGERMFIRVLSARPGAFFVEASEGASEDRKKMALTSGGSRRREAARGGAMERGD